MNIWLIIKVISKKKSIFSILLICAYSCTLLVLGWKMYLLWKRTQKKQFACITGKVFPLFIGNYDFFQISSWCYFLQIIYPTEFHKLTQNVSLKVILDISLTKSFLWVNTKDLQHIHNYKNKCMGMLIFYLYYNKMALYVQCPKK